MEFDPSTNPREKNRDSRKHYYASYKDDFFPSDKNKFKNITEGEEELIERTSKEKLEKMKQKYKYFDYIPELSAKAASYKTITKLTLSNMLIIGTVGFPFYFGKRPVRAGYNPSSRVVRRDIYFFVATVAFYSYLKAKFDTSQQDFFKDGMRPLALEERTVLKIDERYSHFRHIDPILKEKDRYTQQEISEAKDIAHWVLAEKVEKIRNSSNSIF